MFEDQDADMFLLGAWLAGGDGTVSSFVALTFSDEDSRALCGVAASGSDSKVVKRN